MKEETLSEIIHMAWDDKVTFNDIEKQFQLNEDDIKKIMKKNLKPKAYQNWRERVRRIKER